MLRRHTIALLAAALAAAVAAAALAGDKAARPNPRKAAAALVARLQAKSKRAHMTTFAASKVVRRNGRRWLAVGSTLETEDAVRTHVRVYRWSGAAWTLRGIVNGDLGPSQWIEAVSLTGSKDPDFAIEGCGAGDTSCLGVVSDIGGRWHAVPFVYGYGRATEADAAPAGHLVQTAVNACGCAGGPATWMYERYGNGAFEPADPPRRPIRCTASSLASAADPSQVKVLEFRRVACADGWALAVGSGAGFAGRVVGLFDRGVESGHWHVLTLDDGLALPAAPALYDLPLGLLARLARNLGLAREIAAARLIRRLQSSHHFYWPQQEGIVRAGASDWLIAVIPIGRERDEYSPHPVRAIIYRWGKTGWKIRGRIRRLPKAFDLDYFYGWFVGAQPRTSSAVAFALAGSDSHDKRVITNAGGRWHLART